MTRSSDKVRAAAQGLRDDLAAEVRPFEAEIITRLIRASATSTTTNALLSEDNMRLREQLRQAGLDPSS